MELPAPSRPRAELAHAIEREYQRVKRWPGLRGEPKIAWKFLADECVKQGRSLPAQLTVTSTEVGEDQGTSTDAGRRALERLVTYGLVRCQMPPSLGSWDLEVLVPTEVAKARRDVFDPQSNFLAEEDEAPPDDAVDEVVSLGTRVAEAPVADVSPLPRRANCEQSRPRAREDLDLKSISNQDLHLDLKTLGDSRSCASTHRGSGPGSAITIHEPAQSSATKADFAGLAERLAGSVPSSERLLAAADGIAEQILARVADPQLYRHVAFKAAWAIVSGTDFDLVELGKILSTLDDLRERRALTREPRRYFIASVRRRFRELGVAWEQRR